MGIQTDEELTRKIADLVRWIRANYPNFNSRKPIDRLNSELIDACRAIEDEIWHYYEALQ